MLSKAAGLDPAAAALQYRIAVSHYFLGPYYLAGSACAKALELDPQYAAPYFLIGMTDLHNKDITGAQNDLHKAVSLATDVPLFHRELGKVLLQARNFSEASKELEQALSLDSKNAENYFWRAKLFATVGANKQAIADFNTAVPARPELCRCVYRTCTSLHAGGPAARSRECASQPQASNRFDEEIRRRSPAVVGARYCAVRLLPAVLSKSDKDSARRLSERIK